MKQASLGLGHDDQVADHRQRQRLPLEAVRQDLPGAGDQAFVYQALLPADQRQGRALHPDLPARLGLRPDLGQQRRTHSMAFCLLSVLQRPSATLSARLPPSSLPPARGKRVETQQLDSTAQHFRNWIYK